MVINVALSKSINTLQFILPVQYCLVVRYSLITL